MSPPSSHAFPLSPPARRPDPDAPRAYTAGSDPYAPGTLRFRTHRHRLHSVLIAFLGDSLTEGWPGTGYFRPLDLRLTRHELLNRGRAGDTVGDLLDRMRRQGLDPVDCVFIWVGANDAVMSGWDPPVPTDDRVSPERLSRLTDDYEELLDWAEARASCIVVVRPLILESEGAQWETRANDVADAIERVAARRRSCRVVDLRPAFEAAAARGEGPFTTDGVHFTEAGADVVSGAFAQIVFALEKESI